MTMSKLSPLFVFLLSCIASVSYTQSLDLTDLLNQTESDYNQGIKDGEQIERDAARQAAERARNRDTSNDVCYQMPSGSDAQTACLGKYPNSVRNERARNILLGYCSSMGDNTELSNDLSYVCSNGVSACSSFDDGDAAYHCRQCGATPRWLAVYSLGHLIKCFN